MLAIVPASGATTGISIFIASMIITVSPASTFCPTDVGTWNTLPAAPAPVAAAEDDAELVAVIAAAIAAAEGTSTDGFVVRSIKRRKSNRWN